MEVGQTLHTRKVSSGGQQDFDPLPLPVFLSFHIRIQLHSP